jgi:hypothetical protein
METTMRRNGEGRRTTRSLALAAMLAVAWIAACVARPSDEADEQTGTTEQHSTISACFCAGANWTPNSFDAGGAGGTGFSTLCSPTVGCAGTLSCMAQASYKKCTWGGCKDEKVFIPCPTSMTDYPKDDPACLGTPTTCGSTTIIDGGIEPPTQCVDKCTCNWGRDDVCTIAPSYCELSSWNWIPETQAPCTYDNGWGCCQCAATCTGTLTTKYTLAQQCYACLDGSAQCGDTPPDGVDPNPTASGACTMNNQTVTVPWYGMGYPTCKSQCAAV